MLTDVQQETLRCARIVLNTPSEAEGPDGWIVAYASIRDIMEGHPERDKILQEYEERSRIDDE